MCPGDEKQLIQWNQEFEHFPWLIIREELKIFTDTTQDLLSFLILTKLTTSDATTAEQRGNAFP